MQQAKGALWRIEYRTDVTQANSLIVPVGYLMEAVWPTPGAKWLGIVVRRRLTPLELDQVNLETWPELSTLESFMIKTFDEVWQPTGAVTDLGSQLVATRYSEHSALHFARDSITLPEGDFDPSMFGAIYLDFLDLPRRLAPAVIAPVVTLPTWRRPAAAAPDVEQQTRAA
jgi:hypothetical protein